jgi:hypothetical protein
MAKQYTVSDGPFIKEHGKPMLRKMRPTYFLKATEAATIINGGATQQVVPGDYVTYNPVNGAVGLCTADSYKNYVDASE